MVQLMAPLILRRHHPIMVVKMKKFIQDWKGWKMDMLMDTQTVMLMDMLMVLPTEKYQTERFQTEKSRQIFHVRH